MIDDDASADWLDAVEPTLDWTVFADPARSAIVEGLDCVALAKSATLQRVVDLAAAFAESKFAQISLIGDAQYVPVAHGIAPSIEGTPIPDSLCSVTMAAGQSVVIGDAARHAWVRDLFPVASGQVGSYLGVPLRNSNGVMLGALCVYNDYTTVWPNHLAGALQDLLTFAATEIEQIATIDAHEHSLEQLTIAIQHIVAPPRWSSRTESKSSAAIDQPTLAATGTSGHPSITPRSQSQSVTSPGTDWPQLQT